MRHATPHVLPLSFTVLSLPHPVSFLFLPPSSFSHPECPLWVDNYNTVETLTPLGSLSAYFCLSPLSLCLGIFLSCCVSVYTFFFLSLHSRVAVSLSFCVSPPPPPTVPLTLFELLPHFSVLRCHSTFSCYCFAGFLSFLSLAAADIPYWDHTTWPQLGIPKHFAEGISTTVFWFIFCFVVVFFVIRFS